ncbi:unnamed protein product [Leptidea sinapis]|uniref:Protein sleepless n=1 Tax=Leptidea sinapis TaxID=189913 RepID=A0A5E4R4B6_9NEOP|nr:unnamed protein product [Leptidea sinapis]
MARIVIIHIVKTLSEEIRYFLQTLGLWPDYGAHPQFGVKMKTTKYFFLFVFFCKETSSLMCYNCSTTNQDLGECAGDFVNPTHVFNETRFLLVNCTGDNAMCFVRSWASRSKHAWIVQRGCYHVSKDDETPRTMRVPNRAMTLADGEYNVCLCQADWCNTVEASYSKRSLFYAYLLFMVLQTVVNINYFVSIIFSINFGVANNKQMSMLKNAIETKRKDTRKDVTGYLMKTRIQQQCACSTQHALVKATWGKRVLRITNLAHDGN